MEGPLEGADVSPDSQDPDADRRFAVCSFRNTHKEKKPAHQIQAMDPRPSTLAVGATQGDSLSKKPESLPEQRAANGAGDCQGSLLGGPPVQSEEPPFSEVESLLYPMSSHLSLTQSDNQGGGLIGDPGPGKARPAGVSPLSEMSSKLLEADPSGSSFQPADCLLAQDITWELLASGMASLPGTRDVEGRAVLLLCAHSPAWLHPKCNSYELLNLLFYLRGIPRSEVQALGLTILVDARICSPSSSLIWGLSQLQEAAPGSVQQLLLVGKMPEEMPTGLQFKQLSSHQSLLAHIPDVALPTSLGGCLPYSHQAWLDFRMRLETLQQNCQETCALIQGVIDSMKAMQQPMESGEVGQLLQQVQSLMQQVLDSPQLSWLQSQGSLELAWLKQGMPEVTLSPDNRSAVDKADELYGQVDGLLHQLTLQSNHRVQALELLQTLEAQEDGLRQIEVWLQEVGWPGLEEPEEPSLDLLLQAQGPFQELDQVAQEQIKQGEKLLQPLVGWEAAELGPLGKHFLTLRSQLTEFSRALAQRRQRLADAEKLFQFFKQATTWTEEGQRVLTELEQELPGVVLQRLQLHWTRHPDLPPAHFRKMWALATGLRSEGIRQECRWAWAQCQDTWLALDQKLEAALKPPTNSTATLCVRRAPATPTIPPLRKAYSFDRNLGQRLSDAAHHGHFAAAVTDSYRPETGGVRPRSSPSVPLSGSSDFRNPNRLQLVLAEMVATEHEYVRALDYTMQNYFPELDRPDVPQGLRGQRAHLFGNLEKLRDFHYHFFLRELEACTRHPPRVAYAFLRHRVQFGMYALYSKNKPRSDALMSSYGHTFFKEKQQALGDHLDLASYLLKPIQRMSKYALLLQELARACGGPAQELGALQAAQSLVHFQLRHGNDLLAMDAIQGCDVNLKEQGQLVRQDEFTVRTGRHKCCRRVFLFEELLLFSKPRRGPAGVDIFTYKRSFKMADLGLTECCGESKLRFEIWFRRRKARDLFVLQASNVATKQAWTADISRLLWRQAVHNKEVRMAEMASMGVGNKAFWDIAPSEQAINDRSINYVLKRRDVRSRASIAVAPFDYDNPYLGALGSLPGDRASCSVLGSLNLHLYRDPALMGVHWSLYPPNFPEEAALEAEAEMGSQSLTPEDSEVSSQCPSASGSSGSDSSCVSGQTLGRGLEDLSCV
ncbi:puratrophin-1 [Cricetulus griseus]|uniref:Pleckstrin homology domain containing, family G (with RhoGef domain) member 4 n=1 Tax=Cricetulus griseus TaxID=10029 RepID=A0A8C2MD24_CRIGR|nr:puratrophin-1 [Cricetulus griseus]XP_027261616.1 puratrophin-1 [Cricetulus griseus]XP_027261617.1 puratrophin-1 [Cricetulus griseus]XP_027261619.1 puratrophin-1 [Cricetulus griseus]XP_027296655.1 puratrophin-1 [Cricetulus griseus]XP_027296657.1 puratrophin-1 [Cricetulus griseus]XP_035298521.1 puratrophin-1 [Cricetulus griseus]XP_035298522.1 puratrophin-1 [Cricetulus griseus]XP_035315814.1 puratrophin-1 [Cricetulus griseus]XP_035315815.1 puratrophin-1 [Cricetulus griseus]